MTPPPPPFSFCGEGSVSPLTCSYPTIMRNFPQLMLKVGKGGGQVMAHHMIHKALGGGGGGNGEGSSCSKWEGGGGSWLMAHGSCSCEKEPGSCSLEVGGCMGDSSPPASLPACLLTRLPTCMSSGYSYTCIR